VQDRHSRALHEAMQQDPSVICYGLGVTDPKAVFGTTSNLEQRFGSERVFDMPTSENAMTGVAIGAALNGIKGDDDSRQYALAYLLKAGIKNSVYI